MSAPYEAEMPCYCEHCDCDRYTNYRHKDDWSEPSDFACHHCFTTCYEEI